MRLSIFFILIFISTISFAQKYEKAIVTDLNYIRRPSINVNQESFPYYFHYNEFVADVQDEIARLVKERFGVDEVLFLNPDSIYYVDLSIAPKTEAKDFAVVTKRENTIFISVETILQDYAFLNEEQVYRFTTRVNVYNYKGRNIYDFKNHIPFATYFGEEISGNVQMGEQDFYTFYFDGLNLALEGVNKTVSKRYVARPTADKYSDFIAQSLKFYLQTESNGYTYGTDNNNLSEIVSFTVNYWETENDVFDFINLVTIDFLDNGYNFINRLDNKEYTVKLKGGTETLKNKFDPKADIDFQLLNAEGRHVGFFTYQGLNLFYGKYDGIDYKLKWISEYSCIEVSINKEQLALINYFPDSKILYLSKNISREQLTSLVNIMFVLDYSIAIRERLFAVYNN